VRGADLVRHDLLLLEGRVAEARRLLDETLAAEPHSALALDRRSTHRLLDLDVPGALDDRRRVINVSPLAPESYSALANYLLLTGDAAGARQAFDRALLLRPNWQAAQVGLVVSLRTLGEQDAAASLARELIARGARSGQLWAAAPVEDRQRLAAQVASRGSLREKAELALAQGSTEPMLGLLERVPTLVADRPYLLFAQRYDRLREEPRFQAWLQREGLADAQARAQTWRATR
jgi:tetratricopeptide (TPR) repeat protein